MPKVGAIQNIPHRLRCARDSRKLTTREVSERLAKRGIRLSHTSIAKYETGESLPSVKSLEAIAGIYEKPVSWFLDPGTPLAGAVFRNLPSRVSEAKKQQYVAEAHRWLEAYLTLESRVGQRLTQVISLELSGTPQELAASVRKRAGIPPDNPIPSVIRLLEDFGIRTIEVPTELAIDGMACRFGDEFAVVLNPSACHDRARMNAAHELGHVLLGDCDSPKMLTDADTESRAYEFASHLLLPQSELRKVFQHRSLLDLLTCKERFGVSMQAMIYRASHGPERLLNDRAAKWLWIQFAKRGWRKREPGRVGPDRATRFERMLEAAISRKNPRLSEVEAVLGVSRNDVLQRINSAIDQCLDGEQGGDGEDQAIKFVVRDE
ncbi:MAG: ImmA/IrrE family metallo-endopeptidase [Planctomycetaceae bacterium]|nr:ImmA/IrrE family metallo-endopeptidase [Planctomycetaceae bacterium]